MRPVPTCKVCAENAGCSTLWLYLHYITECERSCILSICPLWLHMQIIPFGSFSQLLPISSQNLSSALFAFLPAGFYTSRAASSPLAFTRMWVPSSCSLCSFLISILQGFTILVHSYVFLSPKGKIRFGGNWGFSLAFSQRISTITT